MNKIGLASALCFMVANAAGATGCETDADGCSGTWAVQNTTAMKVCYSVFLVNGASKNFCLEPGEDFSMRVQTGDRYCVENYYTPSPNTCNRQAMFAVMD